MKSEVNAPWETEECFPEKPPGSAYGYWERGKPVACSQEELQTRCSGLERPGVELVWHPDAPRLVTVWSVPFLQGALRTREKATIQHNLKLAAFNVLVFCLFGINARGHGGYFTLFLFFGFFFGIFPLYQSWRELRRFDQIKWDSAAESNPFDRYDAWVGSRPAPMTWSLLGIITYIGLLGLSMGIISLTQVIDSAGLQSPWTRILTSPGRTLEFLLEASNAGFAHSTQTAGLVKSAVREHHQWWRLFTAPFLHGSLLHFLFNASALVGLGRLVEALAGWTRLALVFAISALGGSLLSLYLMPHATSVGASGGLLGLIGFLLVLGYRRKALLPPEFVRLFVMNVALVVVMGIVARGVIDNAAHLGGFLCGVLAGALMVPAAGRLPLPATSFSKTAGILASAGLMGSAIFAACKILGKI